MKTMTKAEFQAACEAQGVPGEHIAVKCPVCGTVQSLSDLRVAHANASPERLRGYFEPGPVDPALHLGFSCVGRFTGEPGYRGGDTGGRGCDWTLGGFLKAHQLEVLDENAQRHPFFDLATPEEAQAHMHAQAGAPAT